MLKFRDLDEVTFEIVFRLEDAARSRGWEILDTGASEQSCSKYVTLRQELDTEDLFRECAVRISNHDAVACVGRVDHDIGFGQRRWADTSVRVEEIYECYDDDEDEDDDDSELRELDHFEVDRHDISAAVEEALIAANAREWEEM